MVETLLPMMNRKFTSANGINTAYFERGNGEALVLVHGGNYGSYSSAYDWNLNIEGLSRSFHVYAFDKLGMGYTDNPKTDDDCTMSGTLKHAHDFFIALGIRKATLIGHSRGGYLVARFALEHPELVKSLVIVDSSTLAPEDPADPTFSSRFYDEIEKNESAVETRETALREIVANSYSTKHITEDYVEDRYRIAILPKIIKLRQKMKTLRNSLFLPDLKREKKETLEMIKVGRLKVPTLLVWGYNDPSMRLDRGLTLYEIISSQIPRSHFHIFNKSGHYPFREHPEDFDRLVTAFIKPA